MDCLFSLLGVSGALVSTIKEQDWYNEKPAIAKRIRKKRLTTDKKVEQGTLAFRPVCHPRRKRTTVRGKCFIIDYP